MPECYTKPKKDGGKYTTCVGFQKGDKAKPKTKPKKMVIKLKEGDKKPKSLKKGARIEVEKPTEPRTIGKDLTGLTKKEMNVMGALELFGRLPVELRKTILNPKETGIQVAPQSFADQYTSKNDLRKEYYEGTDLEEFADDIKTFEFIESLRYALLIGDNAMTDTEYKKRLEKLKPFGLVTPKRGELRWDFLRVFIQKKFGRFDEIKSNDLKKLFPTDKDLVRESVDSYFDYYRVKKSQKEELKKKLTELMTSNLKQSKEEGVIRFSASADEQYLDLKKKHPNSKIRRISGFKGVSGTQFNWIIDGEVDYTY